MNLGEDPGRTIMRGAVANAAGFLLRFGGRLIFLFVAARLYGAHLYGAFVIAAALVELAVAIGGLATKKTLYPLLDRAAETQDRPLGHIVVDAALLVTAVSLALALLIAGAALLFAPSDVAAALVLLAPMVAGQALLDLFIAAARWRNKVRYEVISRSLLEPWFLALGATAAFQLGLAEYGLAAGYWCGTIAALAYAVWGTVLHYPGLALASYRPIRAGLGAIARGAAANSTNDFLNALYTRADLYLVGLLLGAEPAGNYGVARQVATPVRQVWQSFDSLLVPAVSKTIGRDGAAGAADALASASRLILVVQLPLLIAMLAIGRPLLAWLGPGFEAGYWALVILGAAEVLQSALGIGDLVFVYLKPRIGLALTLASIAAGIVAALLLIPSFDITGAAFALLTAYALRSALRFAVLHWRFGMPVPHAHLAGPLAAAGVAAAAALAIPAPALALAAGLALYTALVAAWLKVSGQRLALTGFTNGARLNP
ncbi:lipopolysaccharide biosynthesis protein [Sphingosinicella sp.]|uniref:lipopolysaccharide biosynthesis protein n=1 Tax=Sphingosinicella sp. TaxID=1917971 RepID=UPI004037D7E4